MAISLDGRIGTHKREHITLGTRHDRLLMDKLRARNDAVIVGAGTVRHDGYPVIVRDKATRERHGKSGSPHPLNVILSRELNLPLNRPIFTNSDISRLILTTRGASASRLKRFEKIAEVVVVPRKTIPAAVVLTELAKRGIKSVLLEGGGETHYEFARAGLIDELYVTITPRLIGGKGAPSLLDGKGFLKADHIRLELMSTRRIEDELFLRYKVRRNKVKR